MINLDFNDVNTTLRDGRVAIISSGYGEGEHRVTKAIEDALDSPLLKNRDVYGSQKVLINVYFNPDSDNPFKASELSEIEDFMVNFSQEVDVITGAAYDRTLDDKIKVTVLAAGFKVSLDGDAPDEPAARPRVSRTDEEPSVTTKEAAERLSSEYGNEAMRDYERKQTEAQFFILKPEDIDNDELIDLLERTPAFKRHPDKKKAIEEKRVQRQTSAAPTEAKPAAPAKPGTAATIDFGAGD